MLCSLAGRILQVNSIHRFDIIVLDINILSVDTNKKIMTKKVLNIVYDE